jgi:hypothetical protein
MHKQASMSSLHRLWRESAGAMIVGQANGREHNHDNGVTTE